jgi:hypothetical protein
MFSFSGQFGMDFSLQWWYYYNKISEGNMIDTIRPNRITLLFELLAFMVLAVGSGFVLKPLQEG